MFNTTLESLKKGQWVISRKDGTAFQIEDILEEKSVFSGRVAHIIKLKVGAKTKALRSFEALTKEFHIVQNPYISKVIELERTLKNSSSFLRPEFPQ